MSYFDLANSDSFEWAEIIRTWGYLSATSITKQELHKISIDARWK